MYNLRYTNKIQRNIKLMKKRGKDLDKLKKNLTDAEYKIKAGLALDVEKEIENALFR